MSLSPLFKILGNVKVTSLRGFSEAMKNLNLQPSAAIKGLGVFLIGSVFAVMYVAWKEKKLYLLSLDDPTPKELETMSPGQIALCSLFMTRTASRIVGMLMKVQIPRPMRRPLYSFFCKQIGINDKEIEGNFVDYKCPNDLFTRHLKAGSRVIVDHEDIIVSPVDGVVSYMDCNPITTPNLKAHQVKGIRYLMSDFLGRPVPTDHKENNLYSVTLYLSPSDYHHVHSPTKFIIKERAHFPGKLLPVKNYFVQSVKGLFTINERVVLTGTWKQGFFSLGMVGAYNVGSIALANDQDRDLRTNQLRQSAKAKRYNVCFRKNYVPSVEVRPGSPVGTFHLGSTVVLAFESSEFTWLVSPGEKVKFGQPIGYVRRSPEVDRLCDGQTNALNGSCKMVSELGSDSDETQSVGEEEISAELSNETIEFEETGDFELVEVEDTDPEGESIYVMKANRRFKRVGSWTCIDLLYNPGNKS